jgi:hypothetical protein
MSYPIFLFDSVYNNIEISVADPDPGSSAFLTLGTEIGKNPDPG